MGSYRRVVYVAVAAVLVAPRVVPRRALQGVDASMAAHQHVRAGQHHTRRQPRLLQRVRRQRRVGADGVGRFQHRAALGFGKPRRSFLKKSNETLIVHVGRGGERIVARFDKAVGVPGLPQRVRHHLHALRHLRDDRPRNHRKARCAARGVGAAACRRSGACAAWRES